MAVEVFDFSGWATRNDLRCSDGRVIRRDAFKDNDRDVVPLIWQHDHSSPANVIGHALLQNREDGVYAYCSLNNNERGEAARQAVLHGDIDSLSIYANQLQQNGHDVVHGVIREVSLVMHGANPGAYIDNIIQHSDGTELYGEEGFIYNDETIRDKTYYLCQSEDGLYISDEDNGIDLEEDDDMYEEEYDEELEEDYEDDLDEELEEDYEDDLDEDDYDEDLDEGYEDDYDEELEHADRSGETIGDIFEDMTEEQKLVVYYMVGMAMKMQNNNEEDETMKHNLFDEMENDYVAFNTVDPNALAHGEELLEEVPDIFEEAFRNQRSLKDTVLMHAANYGIDDIDWLFPDPRTYTTEPEFITRNMEWVASFLNNTKKSPFSRIKTVFADITADTARARGYVKGNRKIEEVFSLLKRATTPTTIYKKQAFDRDDVIDITSFDVVAYVRKEMRVMLNEEIARACLVGDGRDPVQQANDKIDETCVRPIYTDDDLFSIKVPVVVAAADNEEARAKKLVKAVIKARKNYKGTGNPTFYTTEDVLADLLLVEDGIGRRLYRTKDELATALLVKEIVTVPVMENLTRTDTQSVTRTLAGIIVNPIDYNYGTDQGGKKKHYSSPELEGRIVRINLHPYSPLS